MRRKHCPACRCKHSHGWIWDRECKRCGCMWDEQTGKVMAQPERPYISPLKRLIDNLNYWMKEYRK